VTSRPTNIIRRHHTRFFTTLPNEIFNDERLALDEMALLGWLLSRPHDWEVIPAQIRKRFKVGRDKFYRLMTSLCNAGYVKREKERAKDGTISCIRYVVTDDPAIPVRRVTQEEVDSESDSESDNPAVPSASVAPLQQPEKPDTADPDTVFQGPGLSNDIYKTPPYPPLEPMANPQGAVEAVRKIPEFKELLSKWPSGSILSSSAAERRFLRLDADRKAAAVNGIAGYLAGMRLRGWKVCDLQTYLRDRRWEKVGGNTEKVAYLTKGGTPQAFRWLEYRKGLGEPTAFMEDCWKSGRPWYAPSEWPPPVPNDDRKGEPVERHPPPENNPDLSPLADELERTK
jgi:hypothetical protein